MPWVSRGLRDGVVTTPYPRRPDDYGPEFRGAISVLRADPGRDGPSGPSVTTEAVCPTGAIVAAGSVRVDRGRCILCGRCVATHPGAFGFAASTEVSVLPRSALVVPATVEDDASIARVRQDLHRRVRALRRSVHVRHVDAGSDGSDEWEVAALTNPVYDVQRLGIYFTATPRHADVLLVTGAGAHAMQAPLLRTLEAMPEPTVVIAAGTDAISGGLISPTYAVAGGVGEWLPVDVWIPGSPPSPFSLLHGLLLAVGLVPSEPTP